MKLKSMKKLVALGAGICVLTMASVATAENYFIPWLDNTNSWSGLALSNEDDFDKDVTVNVYDPQGVLSNTEHMTIPAGGQRHFVVGVDYKGQGSIAILSPDGPLTGTALEGRYDKQVMTSVGTTEGFCNNLINHIVVSPLWIQT